MIFLPEASGYVCMDDILFVGGSWFQGGEKITDGRESEHPAVFEGDWVCVWFVLKRVRDMGYYGYP